MMFAYLKILQYMKIFEQLAFLVQMLITTMKSILTFMIFFVYALLFFTQCGMILKVDYEGDDYANVIDFIVIFIQTFRNSLGDTSAPGNGNWDATKYDNS